MKKDEIKVGKTYVGKNGRKRTVVGLGGVVYASQIDTDTVAYIDPDATGRGEKDMTRASFAAWAERVA